MNEGATTYPPNPAGDIAVDLPAAEVPVLGPGDTMAVLMNLSLRVDAIAADVRGLVATLDEYRPLLEMVKQRAAGRRRWGNNGG